MATIRCGFKGTVSQFLLLLCAVICEIIYMCMHTIHTRLYTPSCFLGLLDCSCLHLIILAKNVFLAKTCVHEKQKHTAEPSQCSRGMYVINIVPLSFFLTSFIIIKSHEICNEGVEIIHNNIMMFEADRT